MSDYEATIGISIEQIPPERLLTINTKKYDIFGLANLLITEKLTKNKGIVKSKYEIIKNFNILSNKYYDATDQTGKGLLQNYLFYLTPDIDRIISYYLNNTPDKIVSDEIYSIISNIIETFDDPAMITAKSKYFLLMDKDQIQTKKPAGIKKELSPNNNPFSYRLPANKLLDSLYISFIKNKIIDLAKLSYQINNGLTNLDNYTSLKTDIINYLKTETETEL